MQVLTFVKSLLDIRYNLSYNFVIFSHVAPSRKFIIILLGEFPTSRGVNTTWQGQGRLEGSRITVINRSAICSEGKERFPK